MENNDKKLNSLIEGLSDNNRILETLEKIRLKGNVKILPYLFEAVLLSKNEKVVNEGKKLLFDIKDKNAVPYIFDALKSGKYKEQEALIVSIIWEAGLDCREYVNELIALAINGELATVIEVLSVIENIESIDKISISPSLERLSLETKKSDENDAKIKLLLQLSDLLTNTPN